MNSWTPEWYRAFRVLLGAYLMVHFAQLLPWAGELFSSTGMLPGSASPILLPFNILYWWDAPPFVTVLVATGAALSLALALGYRDRIAAVLLWYIWACLFGRNPLIANPSLPYVGMLLLVHAATPAILNAEWRFPKQLYQLLWVLMAVGYTYSGVTKLVSPSWLDGNAVRYILENPLARPTALREWVLGWPQWALAGLTYGTLAVEISFAPAALFKRARPWLWAAMLGLHVSLLVFIDFADLTVGMVLLHAITFDPQWLRWHSASKLERAQTRSRRARTSIQMDGRFAGESTKLPI